MHFKLESRRRQKLPPLFFANVFVPNLRMLCVERLHQLAALAIVEIDNFDTVFAQPLKPSGESAAVAHDKRTDSKLANKTAAVPAGGRRRHHHQVAITRLAAGGSKGVSLAVNAGIAPLHAAIAAPAE